MNIADVALEEVRADVVEDCTILRYGVLVVGIDRTLLRVKTQKAWRV